MSKKLPACLAGARMMGHTWAVTRISDKNEEMYCLCSEGVDAVREYDLLVESQRGRIFAFNFKRRRWVRMSRAAAVIAS